MALRLRAFGAAMTPESRGILAVLFAFLSFAVMDTAAKHLMHELHPVQVVWARYASQTAFIVVILAPRLKLMARTQNPGLQLVRSGLLFTATLLFFSALSLMKFAEAAALMQTAPLFITALAAPVLGEMVGVRRWVGVAVGLVGALIIIRPGLEVFQPAGLLPLGGAVCLALYQITTRMLSANDRIWTTMLYTAGVGTLIATLAVPFFWTQPTLVQGGLMALMGVIAGFGHLALVYGFGQAQAAVLAPFNYTSLVWATLFGYLVFAELPDAATVAGAALVVVAGLYVWQRERARKLGARAAGR
ncbi:MAG TPA: DMT family transporter [Thermohalobaculum sp.]|nr:DMT family transporter [Thermohalobaculum sp.]